MNKKVLIDSGHSPLTAGKRAFDNSFFEYEFNYDVSNRIKKHLARHGVDSEVLQVRNTSSTNELNTRVDFINKSGADIVVSVHANAFGSNWNDANGWEIFCYKMQGESLKLAQAIQKNSIPYLGLRDRGIKDGSAFAVVGKTNPPAVLIEHGFYTNKEEVAKLKSDEFREMCAIADTKGILEYFGIAWIEEPKPEPIPVEPEPTSEYLYKVQVGAFAKEENANAMKDKLIKAGFTAMIVKVKKGE